MSLIRLQNEHHYSMHVVKAYIARVVSAHLKCIRPIYASFHNSTNVHYASQQWYDKQIIISVIKQLLFC